MSIYTTLKNDHVKIKGLLKDIDALGDSKPAQRQKLFMDLKAFLTAHAKTEESIFYRRLEDHTPAEPLAREGEVEHGVAERLMKTLSTLEPDNAYWLANFAVLKEAVEHHIDEEEKELFAKAKKAVDDKEAELMGEKMEAKRRQRYEQEIDKNKG